MAPPRLQTLVDRFAATRESIAEALATRLARLWVDTNVYSAAEVVMLAKAATSDIAAQQRVLARASEAYLRATLFLLGSPARDSRAVTLNPAHLRQVDLVEAYERPARDVRYLRSTDVVPEKAYSQGLDRLQVMADTDLSLAMRDTFQQIIEPMRTVVGYRRIIRPELSKHGSCGLCVAAADRKYAKAELLPLHGRCNCIVLPIVDIDGEESDPGIQLNGEDLLRMYKAAGAGKPGNFSTYANDLKRIRVQVNTHGEVGPVLSRADWSFRDRLAAEEDKA